MSSLVLYLLSYHGLIDGTGLNLPLEINVIQARFRQLKTWVGVFVCPGPGRPHAIFQLFTYDLHFADHTSPVKLA